MTDITRLLASLKRRSAHAKEFGDSITFVKLKDIDALVEALEKAQGMEGYWKTQCRGITDHCEQLQAQIVELESRPVTTESFTCPRCERTTTHPEGWHYCHKREG
ncbi:hypothetical protein [Klebsiella aerogenes]|uniref:hypothetical protein n=1 Tax=Klebsiella aerogenes TaxID=548 RepID=UPI0025A89992|nr:hypothetical protein [Klebsiella aerogenes]ELD8623232.1 hypothetical protein [Klebsiella aerogenes]